MLDSSLAKTRHVKLRRTRLYVRPTCRCFCSFKVFLESLPSIVSTSDAAAATLRSHQPRFLLSLEMSSCLPTTPASLSFGFGSETARSFSFSLLFFLLWSKAIKVGCATNMQLRTYQLRSPILILIVIANPIFHAAYFSA